MLKRRRLSRSPLRHPGRITIAEDRKCSNFLQPFARNGLPLTTTQNGTKKQAGFDRCAGRPRLHTRGEM
jgi:hypothetical protein